VIVGNLDKDDGHSVGVLDPHLQQAPGLPPWPANHGDPGGQQPLALSLDIAYLNPHGQAIPGSVGGPTAHFEEAVSQEEDQARVIGTAELSIDRQSQGLSIEAPATCGLTWTQQNATAQYLHALILPCSAAPELVRSRHDHVTHADVDEMHEIGGLLTTR
jgi:hypothetical protein